MSDELDRMEDEAAFLAGFKLSKELDLELGSRGDIAITPLSIDSGIDWLMNREVLEQTRRVGRELEMTVEMWINPAEMIQFCGDVKTYGLYEAVLMLPLAHRDRVMHDVLVDLKLKALPKRPIASLKPTGNVVTPTGKKSLRPESIWTLQKHLIVDRDFDRHTEQIFIRALPSHKSQQFINIAKEKNVWEAVVAAPIEHRESLAARLLAYYGIKEPITTPNQKRFIREGVEKKQKDRVLVIDKAGNAWTWACGWFRIGENGQRLDAKPVMGHASFKRRITPADPSDYARSSFRYTRPWGQWRRGSGPVYHTLFGNGHLVLTDGIHAVVEFADGVKREVVLDNLQSIAVRSVSRPAADKSKVTKSKPTKKELSLEEMLKML